MERGRETRRGGPASAPRRPRTSGFKDAPAGEDGDDIMDDAQNPRLRERAKKDSSSVTAVQGILSSSLGCISRAKRKRQGLQEFHGQARSSTVDEIDATTEDTEIGPSEEDDDLPPPPIPRRSVKSRPQGKFLDDVVSVDLPAIPRKARTAILKRPQESSLPAVDSSSFQGSTAMPRNPTPSSVPSSSSVVSLKAGRRTNLSNAKPRARKVPKASSPVIISDQEAEVAEALFDLARMCTTNQLASSVYGLVVDSKCEAVADVKCMSEPKVDLDTKSGPNSSAENFATRSSPRPSSASPHMQISSHTTSASLSICSPQMSPVPSHTAPLLAVPLLIGPSSSPSQTPSVAPLPPAEAPKRKRPRIRARLDDATSVPQLCPLGNMSTVCSLPGPSSPHPKPEFEQTRITTLPSPDMTCLKQVSTAVVNYAIVAPSGPSSALRPMESGLEASLPRSNSLNNRTVSVLSKVEVSSIPVPLDKRQSSLEGRPSFCSVSSAGWIPDIDAVSNSMPRVEPLSESEVLKRSPVFPSSAKNGSQSDNLNVDLMAASLTMSAVSVNENKTMSSRATTKDMTRSAVSVNESKTMFSRAATKDILEKGHVDFPTAQIDTVSDTARDQEHEIGWVDTECERVRGHDREMDGEQGKWGENEMSLDARECDRIDLAKHPPHRPGRALKSLSGTHKFDLVASINSASIPTPSLASSPLAAKSPTASTSGSISTSVSVGMATWPSSLAPVGYYGTSSAGTSWPGGASLTGMASADENSKSSVRQHQYVIQAHQARPWKRCASHVYIAHFIDLQQQMNRHPFIQAAYQNSASLYGAKPYSLNISLPSAEALLSTCTEGRLTGVCGATGARTVTSVGSEPGLAIASASGKESNTGGGATSIVHAQTKDRVYMESMCRKQTILQQPSQLSPNLSGGSGFGFPIQDGTAADLLSSAAGTGGVLAESSGSTLVSMSSTSVAGAGSGPRNGGVVSHEAHYLQTIMQHSGFPFPFQAAAHFGHGFSSPPVHIGHQQQVTQFFSSPFYTSHLVHPLAHAQHQVQESTNISAGLASVLMQPQQQQMEREGQDGELNSSDSKCTILQLPFRGQGKTMASPRNLPSPVFPGGGLKSLPPEDFNVITGLGEKHSKSQQQCQMVTLQQQQVPLHHHSSAPVLMGVDPQPSGVSLAALNRGTFGPGPLGLVPVAAVMAPQGHALFQDPMRGPPQHQQPQHHHHGVQIGQQQQQQQQQRTTQMTMVTSSPSGLDDVKAAVNGNCFSSSRSGKEISEDRRNLAKRGMGSSSTIGRDEPHTTAPSVKVLSGGPPIPRVTGNVCSTLNLMTPTSSVPLSRPLGFSQQPNPMPLVNQNSKQAMARSKFLAGSGVTTLSPSSQFQGSSFPERAPLGAFLSSKGQEPALSSSGQNQGQAPRHSQVHQHSQVRQSSWNSMGSSPTLPGTASQVVLGAAVVKSQQGSQHEPFRQQVPLATSNGPSLRLPASSTAAPLANLCTPLSLPTPSKPTPSGATKSHSSFKGSLSLSHKPSSGLSSKRSAPSSSLVVCSISGPSPVQNLALRTGSLQQGQNHAHPHQFQQLQLGDHSQQPFLQHHQTLGQNHTQSSQSQIQTPVPLSNTLQQQQYHKQGPPNAQHFHQVHSKSMQHQTHNVHHVFPSNLAFQQQQQMPGSPSRSHPQQQSSHQMHQVASSSLPQPQQHLHCPPQVHQQELQQHLQLSVQVGPGLFSATSVNGSLPIGPPTLMLGMASNRNSTSSSLSDSLLGTHSTRSRPSLTSNSKVTSSLGIVLPNSGTSHKSHCGGPPFVHTQFVSSITCGQKHPTSPHNSPRNSPVRQYLQASATSASTTKPVEQITLLDGKTSEQQANGLRLLSSSSPSRVPQMTLSGLSGLQSIPSHPATGGTAIGKPKGCQFAGNNYEGIGTGGGLILSVAPPSSTCNNMSSDPHSPRGSGNSGVLMSNVHLDTDGRSVLFGGGSSPGMSEAAVSQLYAESIHQSLPLMETSTKSIDTQSGQPGTLGQTSSVVQS